MRIIKKYPNRRLYDTQISSYITLEDIRKLIVDAIQFQVLDAKTGQDLTRSVMLQIISEHEERGDPIFSTEVLAQLIRFYGDALQGFMGRYLERSLEVFMEQQQQFRSHLNDLVGQAPFNMVNDEQHPDMPQAPVPPSPSATPLRAIKGKKH